MKTSPKYLVVKRTWGSKVELCTRGKAGKAGNHHLLPGREEEGEEEGTEATEADQTRDGRSQTVVNVTVMQEANKK